jgi:hypothetical protein
VLYSRNTSVVNSSLESSEKFSRRVSLRGNIRAEGNLLLEFDFYWLDFGLHLEIEFVFFVYYVFYGSQELLDVRGGEHDIKSC